MSSADKIYARLSPLCLNATPVSFVNANGETPGLYDTATTYYLENIEWTDTRYDQNADLNSYCDQAHMGVEDSGRWLCLPLEIQKPDGSGPMDEITYQHYKNLHQVVSDMCGPKEDYPTIFRLAADGVIDDKYTWAGVQDFLGKYPPFCAAEGLSPLCLQKKVEPLGVANYEAEGRRHYLDIEEMWPKMLALTFTDTLNAFPAPVVDDSYKPYCDPSTMEAAYNRNNGTWECRMIDTMQG